ncbi:MAG: chromate efflux transporter [Desulfobaccales bacterium]|nr:chromate efflux transporter [Desulfobaccales bacterium]
MPSLPLRDIARLFLHLGVTAYGGLAMVEPIRRRVVIEKAWLSQTEFLDGLALCQMAPGATVVQLATYVGYRLRGAAGALAAAIAFILPAFFLMWGLSFLYFRYGELAWVKAVSRGLNAVVIALLLQALWRLGQAIGRQWLDLAIAFLALLALWLHANYFLVFLTAGFLRMAIERRPFSGHFNPSEASRAPRPEIRLILTQAAASLLAVAAVVWVLHRWDLIWGQMALIFLKIGVISFGGGYVMIPILQWEVVERLGWLTVRQFLDGILLGFVTPGPIIILATFVGYHMKGFLGGLLATISVFLPPILMIIFLSPWYHRVKESRLMRPAIQGILAALVGMLALVTVQMGRTALIDLKDLTLFTGAAVALLGLKINLLWIVAAAACLSLYWY